MEHIADKLTELRNELFRNRDNEIAMLDEVLNSYVSHWNDEDQHRENERQVNALTRAIDRMLALLDKTIAQATTIENSVDSFYGDVSSNEKRIIEPREFVLIPANDETGMCVYWGDTFENHKVDTITDVCCQCMETIDRDEP